MLELHLTLRHRHCWQVSALAAVLRNLGLIHLHDFPTRCLCSNCITTESHSESLLTMRLSLLFVFMTTILCMAIAPTSFALPIPGTSYVSESQARFNRSLYRREAFTPDGACLQTS